jgi:predicted metal-binding membrane protein
MELRLGSRVAAAALLVGAAGWQLSPAKRICLDQCRSPLVFILRLWRPGAAGALRLGLAHGFYCLGCCWALMLLLFVGGVMNLAWIAALAALVLAEKYAPSHWQASRVIAAGLIAGAAALLVSIL